MYLCERTEVVGEGKYKEKETEREVEEEEREKWQRRNEDGKLEEQKDY